jgi:hypothetical protein
MATINSISSNIPIEISKGGTNVTTFSTSTGIVKYDGTSLVTSTTATIDASNRMVNTAQPAFLAQVDSTISDVTGDANTTYTIVFDTETFDQGANFNGTTTFTAPVTGKYFFTLNVLLGGLLVGHILYICNIATSSTTFSSAGNPYVLSSSAQTSVALNTFCAMTAGDTATASIRVANSTKTVDIIGNSVSGASTTFFAGYLVC